MRGVVVGNGHQRPRDRQTWILHARNRYCWVWRRWMERMGDVVGCSVVHRLPENSFMPIAAAALAAAALAASAAASAVSTKIDRMVPFGVGRELRRRVRRQRVDVRHN